MKSTLTHFVVFCLVLSACATHTDTPHKSGSVDKVVLNSTSEFDGLWVEEIIQCPDGSPLEVGPQLHSMLVHGDYVIQTLVIPPNPSSDKVACTVILESTLRPLDNSSFEAQTTRFTVRMSSEESCKWSPPTHETRRWTFRKLPGGKIELESFPQKSCQDWRLRSVLKKAQKKPTSGR